MKLTYALTALVLGLTLSGTAHAKKKKEVPCPAPTPIATPVPQPTPPMSEDHNDARFTFAKAEQYFTHAQLPVASQLVGTWVQTGEANIFESSNSQKGWYSPAGIASFAHGYRTYAANILHSFSFSVNAFGESVLIIERSARATEKDQYYVFETLDLKEVNSLSSGAVYQTEGDDRDRMDRAVTCRLVTPISLLCASVQKQSSWLHKAGTTYSYALFKKGLVPSPKAATAPAPTKKPSTKKSPVLK